MDIKQIVKANTPDPLRRLYRTARIKKERRRNRQRSTTDVFTDVYTRKQWGGEPNGFCSGAGSAEAFAVPYAELVRGLISSFGTGPVRVLDLGCGDFRVAQRFLDGQFSYIGVDIVPALIEHNQKAFGGEGVSFRCLDIAEDPLPEAEICMIRQVLQHLSNEQIASVIRNVKNYPVLVITEHYLADQSHIVPNRDKPHGADTRIYDNSGVYLDKPPYNIRGLESRLRLPVREYEVVETFVVDRRASSTTA